MDWQKLYDELIEKRKNTPAECNYETHHIVPKCIGGLNDNTNLVRLYYREHFIAHLLLSRIYKNTQYYYKMMCAVNCFNRMKVKHNRDYDTKRMQYSEVLKNAIKNGDVVIINPSEGKHWYHNDETQENKLFFDTDVESGWVKGRVLYNHVTTNKYKLRHIAYEREVLIKKQVLHDMYVDYCTFGWLYVKDKYTYTKTRHNFIQVCMRNLPEFVTQKGKKRGGFKAY